MRPSTAPLFLLVVATACAPQPNVDQALAAASSSVASGDSRLTRAGVGMQTDANAAAQTARRAADARPTDTNAQVTAARALFVAADLELRRRVFASIESDPPESVDELLQVEENLPDDVKARVVALADAGTAYASKAIEQDAARADARFFYASCLGIATWGKGVAAAIFQGLGSKVTRAIDDAVKADEMFAGGAPLRARAVFYSRAPWPVGDTDKAVEAAERAAVLSNTVLTHFFCAEVYWRADRKQDAIDAWQRAVTAPAGAFRLAAPFAREFARRALALAAQ